MVKVNDYTISQNEFMLASDDYKVRLGKEKLTREEYIAVLNKLIDARLLIEEAKNNDIKISNDELERSFNSFKSMYKSEDDFLRILSQIGDTPESFKKKLYEDLILRKYINDNFYSGINIDPNEIKRIYDENKDAFVTEDQVDASHILVDTEDEAVMIKNMLKDGSVFEELARSHSKCPSKERGGSLGPFGRGTMVKEFEDAAFALDENEISEPVKTQFGYHIIKMNKKTPGSMMDYESAKKIIESDLANEIVSKKMFDKLDLLRKSSSIEYDQELFDSIISAI
jgi:parvulin-like peptidyl-prolyl isomerase